MKENDLQRPIQSAKKNISKFLKEYSFGLMLLVLAFMWYNKGSQIEHYGKYGIATTQYKSTTRKYERVYYKFTAENGKLYTGTYNQIGKNTPKVKCPNGKYLVIYSSNNPTINVLVDNKEITKEINLDSLKSLTVDPKDWTWNDL